MAAQTIGVDGAVEAPRAQDVLAVGVPVDVELDALGVAEVVDEGGQSLVFRGVGG